MKHKILAAVSIAVILAFISAPVAASTPDQVTIISNMSISSGSGTFEASGPAVEAGVICSAGEVYDNVRLVTAYQGPILVNLYLRKIFVCSDGSGSFAMDLKVRIFNDPYLALPQWVVVDGVGPYARLRGTGGISAAMIDADNLIDTYTGKLHVD